MAKRETGTAPVVISFKDTVISPPMEEGRDALKAGDAFTIEAIFISTKTKYDEIAKINGYIMEKGAPKPVKYRTTSKVIISQCKDFLTAYGDNDGMINPRVSVVVKEVVSDNKGPKGEKISYLTFS